MMFYKFIEHSNINVTHYKTQRNARKTNKIWMLSCRETNII